MINLFKKKEASTNMPPLPEELDEGTGSPQNEAGGIPPLPSLDEAPVIEGGTHANIPNDIAVNPDRSSLTPDSLPELHEDVPKNNINIIEQAPQAPVEMQAEQAPELPTMPSVNTASAILPEIPSVEESTPAAEKLQNIKTEKDETPEIVEDPKPDVDDDIPQPPAIFSEDGFYQTPEEVKHLVGKEKEDIFNPSEENTDEYKVEQIEVSKEVLDAQNQSMKVEGYDDDITGNDEPLDLSGVRTEKAGPIFVDLNSFKTMIDGLDTIKNDIKSSEEILQQLNKIKDSKDKELERWRLQLEDIQRKISYVDKVIFNEA